MDLIPEAFVQGYYQLAQFSMIWMGLASLGIMFLFGSFWGGIIWMTFFTEGRYFFGLLLLFITYLTCSITFQAIDPQHAIMDGPWAFAVCVFNSTVICTILFLVFQRRDESKNPVRTPEQEVIVSAAIAGTTAYLIHKQMNDD